MPFRALSHVLAFLVSGALAVGVILVNHGIYEFWSRRVMYFPDRWMQAFPKWYSELFYGGIYGSYLLTALTTGLVVGIAFGKRALVATLSACVFVAIGYWFLLLISIYGLVFEVLSFWLPMACLFSGVLGGLFLGARARGNKALQATPASGLA